MAADSPRKTSRTNGMIVRPSPFSDKSVVESVVDFISDVVPQTYSGNQKIEDKEKVLWVRLEFSDINDLSRNPDLVSVDCKGLPLLVILGYSNGAQIWVISGSGEAQEILSYREGPIRCLRVLPTPEKVFGENDLYSTSRPILAVCDSSSAGQPFCDVKFVSLKSGDEVHSLSLRKSPVQNIECNKRILVAVLQEKLVVVDACSLKQLFWVTGCYPCPGPNINPIALGTRWLAYADSRLVSVHQSCGGMSGDGAQSYAATVISAAKGAMKGLTMFGEAVVSSVTGGKSEHVVKKSELDNGFRPGIVTVIDAQTIKNEMFNVHDDFDGEGLVAHFHAHANEPVAAMEFDASGTLLVTSCKLSHNFHVFRLMTHPCNSTLGAVHHLYTLHRGDTTAKVVDIKFSHDSRWVTLTTHRGTTHVFPITPYGGPVTVRTHCSSRVVNRVSRFHKSAGIDEVEHLSGGRHSPQLSGSPNTSGVPEQYPSLIRQNALNNNMGNPRLPPYPHPTTVYPSAQIKQPLSLTGIGVGAGVVKSGGMPKSPTRMSTGSSDKVLSVASCFASPRLWASGSTGISIERRDSKRPVESLFVMYQGGLLVEYVLEPRPKSLSDKVVDDAAFEVVVTGRLQWNLLRNMSTPEVKPPWNNNHPLIMATEAVTTQQPNCQDLGDMPFVTRHDSKDSLSSDHSGSKEDLDEQWLSQVEIITHAGPHRRLWMGPQFSFKTYHNVQNATVLSSNSSALLSQSPEIPATAMDMIFDEQDLDSLKLNPARSSPVAMPNTRPAYRREMPSDSSLPKGQSSTIAPLLIEAGSFDQSPNLNDVLAQWSESTMSRVPRRSDEEEERMRETLADAMIESPKDGSHKTFPDVFIGSSENLSSSSSSSASAANRNVEQLLEGIPLLCGSGSLAGDQSS